MASLPFAGYGWLFQRDYSHSIECLKRERLDISGVIFLSCLIGDGLRGYFKFCRRTGGQRVRHEIPCWMLRLYSLTAVSMGLRLQRYAFLATFTISKVCNFWGFLCTRQNDLGVCFIHVLMCKNLWWSTVPPVTPTRPPSLGIGGIPMGVVFSKFYWNFPWTVPTVEVCHFNLVEGICYTL